MDKKIMTVAIWDTTVSHTTGERVYWTLPIVGPHYKVAPPNTEHAYTFVSDEIDVHIVVRNTIHPDDFNYDAARACAETVRESLQAWQQRDV